MERRRNSGILTDVKVRQRSKRDCQKPGYRVEAETHFERPLRERFKPRMLILEGQRSKGQSPIESPGDYHGWKYQESAEDADCK